MFNVHVFCAILCLSSVPTILALSEEMQELITTLHNNCEAESGVAADVLAAGMKKEFPDDPKLKCYMRCLMTELAIMDEDGVVDTEAAIAMLPDDIRSKVENDIRACGKEIVPGPDHCETAFLNYKCLHDRNPENYMLI